MLRVQGLQGLASRVYRDEGLGLGVQRLGLRAMGLSFFRLGA